MTAPTIRRTDGNYATITIDCFHIAKVQKHNLPTVFHITHIDHLTDAHVSISWRHTETEAIDLCLELLKTHQPAGELIKGIRRAADAHRENGCR